LDDAGGNGSAGEEDVEYRKEMATKDWKNGK
jgi:hypothetical protein